MAQGKVEKGDTVQIHYTGKLDDGTVFDTSEGRDPIEFKVGGGEVIAGFDAAVEGMTPGEEKSFTVPATEAYGPVMEELVLTVPKDQLPDGLEPQPGQMLQMQTPQGQVFQVTVVEVRDDELVLDANHPLAGKDLTFDIKVVGGAE
ncbi:MAG: peptidylprolyl isomerase [Gemmatimonadota bacterium]